jgi:DNA polymerase III delta prime subunit
MDILQNAMKTKSCPNIILYGDKYSDKYERLRDILSIPYNLEYLKSVNDDFSYFHTRFYHELDISKVRHKHTSCFKRTIHDIGKRRNTFFDNRRNLVVFRNFNRIKHTIQAFLRVILEKYQKTTIFILLTESLPSIHEAIRSRTLGIRISRDIPNLTHDIYRNACNPIIEIYRDRSETLSLETIELLKEISYRILKSPLDISEVCKRLCQMIGGVSEWSNSHKYYMISYIVKFQKQLSLSYRKIIHIECLLITLWDLSNYAYYDLLTTDDKVDRDDEEQVHVLANTAGVHENHEHEETHVDIGHEVGDRV